MKPAVKPKHLLSLEEHYSTLLAQENSVLSDSVSTQAYENFKNSGFPTSHHEDWKYTSLNNIHAATPINLASNKGDYHCEKLPLCHSSMTVISVAKQRIIGAVPKGVHISFSHRDVDQAKQEKVNRQLAQTLKDDPMLAINQGLCGTVLTVTVSENSVIESPIVIDYGNDSYDHEARQTYLHTTQVTVRLERSAQAVIIECHRNANSDKELSSISCLFDLEQNAHCQHFSVSNKSPLSQHFWYGYGVLKRAANLQSNSVVWGNDMARRFFCNDLEGEGATVTINSVYQAQHKQTLDIRTVTRHLQPNCQSVQLHQGLLADQSNGVFSGIIYVDPVALKTDGQMDNNVMLLSPEAQNNSKPQLEIYADDVKCSHGFTCGVMDENQIYYMRSRGLPEHIARRYILRAFIARVTENLPDFITLPVFDIK